MQDYSLIATVLDKYFEFCKEPGEEYSLAAKTEEIPGTMLDTTQPQDASGYSFWIPIPSAVTDDELAELEALLKHPLPASFKYFLRQRYFLEIYFDDVHFFSNLPGMLTTEFKKMIDSAYPELLARNYLPFASYKEYGVLAFDANKTAAYNEYDIVKLDQGDGFKNASVLATNFTKMFAHLNEQLDESIKQITDYRNNS